MTKTKIGRYNVPVHNERFPTLVTFSAGRKGGHEGGTYCFWTAVLWNTRGASFARAFYWLAPGERFSRFSIEAKSARSKAVREANANYFKLVLERGKAVESMRPATALELVAWLAGHREDASFVTSVIVSNPVSIRGAVKRRGERSG
jgi:hypothetical protein